MRVLFLHKFNFNAGWGGSATMLRALHSALVDFGVEVDVLSAQLPNSSYGSPQGRYFELPFEVTLTFGPEKRAGETALDELSTVQFHAMASSAADKIQKELCGSPPDLIVANHINLMTNVAHELSKRLGVPYRIISYGTDTQLLLRDERYRALFGPAAREADRIFAISGYVAKEIEATVGGNVEVLGGAVDDALFYPSAEMSSNGKGLVYVGRLVTEKGLWPLLGAFERQKSAKVLRIIGEGPLRSALESSVRSSPISDRVIFEGFVPHDNLRKMLISSELVVVPSLWQEPLGLVVLEALACGLPVVASAVGGIPELIADGVTGRLVPPGDETALASAIDDILGDYSVYQRIRRALKLPSIPSYRELAKRVVQ